MTRKYMTSKLTKLVINCFLSVILLFNPINPMYYQSNCKCITWILVATSTVACGKSRVVEGHLASKDLSFFPPLFYGATQAREGDSFLPSMRALLSLIQCECLPIMPVRNQEENKRGKK